MGKERQCILAVDCPNKAYYGPYKGTPLACKDHALPDMVNLSAHRCLLCIRRATHGYPRSASTVYCSDHALLKMINKEYGVKNRNCELCDEVGKYHISRSHVKVYCYYHKKEKMSLVSNRLCRFENCIKMAKFNYEGMPGKRYCLMHADLDMVPKEYYSKERECKVCGEEGKYDFNNLYLNLRCFDHKEEGMLSLITIKKRMRKNQASKASEASEVSEASRASEASQASQASEDSPAASIPN